MYLRNVQVLACRKSGNGSCYEPHEARTARKVGMFFKPSAARIHGTGLLGTSTYPGETILHEAVNADIDQIIDGWHTGTSQ